MEYLQMSQIGTILTTLVIMFIYLYLCFVYCERNMGWWIVAWLLFIVRLIFFDTDFITWNNSVLGFIVYQLLYIVPSFLTMYAFHLFTNKELKNYWLYGIAIAVIFGIVVILMKLPHDYKLAPPLWCSGIILIYTGKMLLDIKMQGIGKYITGVSFVFWGALTLLYPFFHYDKIALLAGPISGVLRLIIMVGILMVSFEKTRADLITKEEHFESLQQANQELNYFCHSVAHDFKSPLQSINKLSQYFMRDYADKVDSNGQELITHIQNKSKEVVGITDHLLELSRMSQKQIAMEDIKLESLFREVYDELIELQPERQVLFKIKQLPMIHGDPIMIKILVANILSNALKYTRNCKQAIIEVTSVEDENNYIISVKDNGAGFDMSESSRLFKIFERLHSVDQFEGTGVGLVVCQKILKRHNGKAWLTGKVNEGANFSFSFPKNVLL